MGRIIAILGPHGVGKTTLQDYIEKNEKDLIFRGFIVPSSIDDFKDKVSYTNYQKKYIKLINKQNQSIKESRYDGYVIRSIEEVPFFLLNKDFDYSLIEINELVKDSISSDLLVYLSADYNTLMQRCNNDEDRDMVENNEWYLNTYEKYQSYFLSLNNIVVIDTTNKTPKEIYQEIKKHL